MQLWRKENRAMTEYIFTAILIIGFAVVVYVAGKGNLIELIPLMLLEKIEELTENGYWTEELLSVDNDICPNCKAKDHNPKARFCWRCGEDIRSQEENSSEHYTDAT